MSTPPRTLNGLAAGLLLAQACAAGAAAPVPVMIDINTGNGPVAGSSPADFARLTPTQTVFAAWDPVHGRELWISDGTPANTHLLADICPGACSSSPRLLNRLDAVTRGVLFLAADDGRIGAELWKVTAAGVVSLVADINPGALGSNPGDMVFPNQTTTMPGYFAATAAATGRELYRTDGTGANTFLIKDVTPGPASTSPLALGAGRTRVYFSGRAPDEGFELYVSDGTADGTAVRAIIEPGSNGSSPRNFVQWQNDTVLFTAFDHTHGRELWLTTPSTTTLLADIATGSTSSNPDDLTAFNGRVFFRADDGTNGAELWSTDATPDGTALFEDLGSGSSFPTGLVTLGTAAGPRLLFVATPSGSAVPRVHVSDGTVAGTDALQTSGLFIFNPSQLTVSGTFAYFIDIASNSLLRTDGSGAGTILIHDFDSDFPDAGIRLGAGVGSGKLLFSLTSPFVGNEPYVSGSGSNSAALLANIAPDIGYSDPRDLTDVQGTLFFSAFAEGVGRELWKAVDPQAGAELVADIVAGDASSDPDGFVALGSRLLFVAEAEALGGELFVSDGSAGGTAALVPTETGAPLLGVQCLTVAGGRAWFFAAGGDDGGEPWTSDGTAAGTHRVDVQPGSATGEGICEKGEPAFAAAGANVLFGAQDPTRGLELFRSAGAAPVFVRDINAGSLSSLPGDFGGFGTRACFAATTPNEGAEPWCSDGTAQGTVPLGDLVPGSVTSQPRQFVQIGSLVVFSASATQGRTIWRSDGTAAGTEPIASTGSSLVGFPPIEPGEFVARVPPLAHVGDTVYFPCPGLGGQFCIADVRPGHGPVFVASASGAVGGVDELRTFSGGDVLMACATAAKGREPCLYTSLAAAIAPALADIAPGASSSSPREFTVSGGSIWFSADDGAHGRELWALPLRSTIDRIFSSSLE